MPLKICSIIILWLWLSRIVFFTRIHWDSKPQKWRTSESYHVLILFPKEVVQVPSSISLGKWSPSIPKNISWMLSMCLVSIALLDPSIIRSIYYSLLISFCENPEFCYNVRWRIRSIKSTNFERYSRLRIKSNRIEKSPSSVRFELYDLNP